MLRRSPASRAAGFEFDDLVPLFGGHIASVGHVSGETRDSLVVLRVDEALADPQRAADSARRELEYAYGLIAGPGERGALVGFRGPEDAPRGAG